MLAIDTNMWDQTQPPPRRARRNRRLALGAAATEIYALTRNEPFVVPAYALIAAPLAGFTIGAIASLYPAARAARLSPTEALRAI